MKQPQHIINIPTPCQEGWDNMTPTEKGRYCAACQKTVVDFTLMTDGEIIDILKKPAGTHQCGRFLNTQLDRVLTDNRYRVPFLKQLTGRAAALALSFQSVVTAVAAQEVKQDTVQEQHVDAVKKTVANDSVATPSVKPAHTQKKHRHKKEETYLNGTFTTVTDIREPPAIIPPSFPETTKMWLTSPSPPTAKSPEIPKMWLKSPATYQQSK